MTINNYQVIRVIPHDDVYTVIAPNGDILGDMNFQSAWSLIVTRLWKGGGK